ncbi:MAG: alkaline phosphatase family protein [Clostridiales bacterium]|nr:alkaline phosphatase family protein [Clostridiales bacterium]
MKLKSLLSPLLILSMISSFTACQSKISDSAVITPTGKDETETKPYVYKHVVIVGVDGAGAFFREADTPNLDEIFANGAVTYEAITSTPSISAECWGSMLHGVTPEFHRLTNGITAVQAYPQDSEFPSVFRVIREQMPDASLASICNFNNINIGIIEDDIGVHKDASTSDRQIIKKAVKYVTEAVENGEGRSGQ